MDFCPIYIHKGSSILYEWESISGKNLWTKATRVVWCTIWHQGGLFSSGRHWLRTLNEEAFFNSMLRWLALMWHHSVCFFTKKQYYYCHYFHTSVAKDYPSDKHDTTYCIKYKTDAFYDSCMCCKLYILAPFISQPFLKTSGFELTLNTTISALFQWVLNFHIQVD